MSATTQLQEYEQIEILQSLLPHTCDRGVYVEVLRNCNGDIRKAAHFLGSPFVDDGDLRQEQSPLCPPPLTPSITGVPNDTAAQSTSDIVEEAIDMLKLLYDEFSPREIRELFQETGRDFTRVEELLEATRKRRQQELENQAQKDATGNFPGSEMPLSARVDLLGYQFPEIDHAIIFELLQQSRSIQEACKLLQGIDDEREAETKRSQEELDHALAEVAQHEWQSSENGQNHRLYASDGAAGRGMPGHNAVDTRERNKPSAPHGPTSSMADKRRGAPRSKTWSQIGARGTHREPLDPLPHANSPAPPPPPPPPQRRVPRWTPPSDGTRSAPLPRNNSANRTSELDALLKEVTDRFNLTTETYKILMECDVEMCEVGEDVDVQDQLGQGNGNSRAAARQMVFHNSRQAELLLKNIADQMKDMGRTLDTMGRKDLAQGFKCERIRVLCRAREFEKKANLKIFQTMNREMPSLVQCDLHGQYQTGAHEVLEEQYEAIQKLNGNVNWKIVTGAGRHSGPSGPKLPNFVRNYLNERNIPFEEETGVFLARIVA